MNDRIARINPTDALIMGFCMDLEAQFLGKPTGHVERAAEITRQMKSSTQERRAVSNGRPSE